MKHLLSRSLFLVAAFSLVSACDELFPVEEPEPVVAAPVVKKAPAAAPVAKKKPAPPVVIDFGDSGSGGGGWSG